MQITWAGLGPVEVENSCHLAAELPSLLSHVLYRRRCQIYSPSQKLALSVSQRLWLSWVVLLVLTRRAKYSQYFHWIKLARLLGSSYLQRERPPSPSRVTLLLRQLCNFSYKQFSAIRTKNMEKFCGSVWRVTLLQAGTTFLHINGPLVSRLLKNVAKIFWSKRVWTERLLHHVDKLKCKPLWPHCGKRMILKTKLKVLKIVLFLHLKCYKETKSFTCVLVTFLTLRYWKARIC